MVLVVKNPPANAGDLRDAGSIPGSWRSPGVGHGNSLQYSCLERPMDRGAWWATACSITKSQRWLKWLSTHAYIYNIYIYIYMYIYSLIYSLYLSLGIGWCNYGGWEVQIKRANDILPDQVWPENQVRWWCSLLWIWILRQKTNALVQRQSGRKNSSLLSLGILSRSSVG